MNAVKEKKCPHCKKTKPLDDFKSVKRNRINATCNECVSYISEMNKKIKQPVKSSGIRVIYNC